MKFFNYELNPIEDFVLNELQLSGAHNIKRMKFLKILAKKQEEFAEDRMVLIKEHSRLDNSKNPVIIKNGAKLLYDIIDQEKFNKAIKDLTNESFVIEENEENKEVLLSVKESLNNCETAFSGEKAVLHAYLCEKFDEIYKET